MNLIFLDVDGVLNHYMNDDWVHKLDHRNWDIESVLRIDALCKATNPHVVISSSWRIMFPDYVWWQNEFHACGADNIHVIGVTPRSRNGFRGREVLDYLTNSYAYDLDKYVIIDDESDFYQFQPRVKVDAAFGFTKNNLYEAFDILDGKELGTDKPCMVERNPYEIS